MRSILGRVAALVLIAGSVAGCSDPQEAAPTTATVASSQPSTQVTTQVTAQLTNAGQAETFEWRPYAGQQIGPRGAAMRSFGIVDGQNGVLYFQGHSKSLGGLYSLFSYDEQTHETKELVPDCEGMVNVTDEAVYYITRGRGVRRYDIASGSTTNVYHGLVSTLLAAEDKLYFVERKGVLYEMEPDGSKVVKVWDYVDQRYLECVDGYLYFAQLMPDAAHCDVYRIPVGSPRNATSICKQISSPYQYVNKKMLYGEMDGVHLLDMSTGKEVTVALDAGHMGAANGNGLFYVRPGEPESGQPMLCAYDLDTGKGFDLLPVQAGAAYFIDGNLYMVDPVDSLNIQKVVLDAEQPHTEWVAYIPGYDRPR